MLALLSRPGSRWCSGPREQGREAADVDRRAAARGGARVQALGLGQAVTAKGPSRRGRR